MGIAQNLSAAVIKRLLFFASVRGKIMLMAGFIAFFVSFVIGDLFYVRIAQNKDIERLQSETRLIGPQVLASFTEMRYDATTIAHMPPVQGLVRSMRNDGMDPLDNSTTQDWKNRLNIIFKSLLASRPHYLQIRYIGIADNGRELVRVDRSGNEIIVKSPADMQQKGNEPYFQDALGLAKEGILFSALTLNREHGKVQIPHVYVLRVMTPVYDAKDNLFGFIVINIQYRQLLEQIMQHVPQGEDVYLINNDGHAMVRERASTTPMFFPATHAATHAHQRIINAVLESDTKEATIELGVNGQKTILHRMRLMYNPDHPDHALYIALAVPVSRLLVDTERSRTHTMYLALTLTISAMLLALLVAHLFVMPLQQINAEMLAYGAGAKTLSLPVHLRDEIGTLARSLDVLTRQLTEARGAETLALARLQAVVDKSVDGMITIDPKGTVLDYNRGCELAFGYLADEVIGKNIKMLMPPQYADHHDGYLKRYGQTREPHIIGTIREVEGRRKDGSTFPLELSVSRIDLPDGGCIFSGILRDISARKDYERKIAGYTEALERSNQELDDFAYIASHDLKEPLRGIHNHSTFLEEDYANSLDDDAHKRLTRIKTLCERAEKLVSELLYFSRLGKGELAMEDTDINMVVDEIRANLATTLEEKNATIIVPQPLPRISCDRVRILSILQNLTLNGIKYNEAANKTVEIGFIPHMTHNGQRWRNVFYVRDNGIGIAPEHHDQIFRLFKRLNPPARFGEGTGAGLTFVKKIIDRHNGAIWLDSKPGDGTSFYFTLQQGEAL